MYSVEEVVGNIVSCFGFSRSGFCVILSRFWLLLILTLHICTLKDGECSNNNDTGERRIEKLESVETVIFGDFSVEGGGSMRET